MPANLTPEYLQAEKLYREAKTSEERLRCLEEMLRVIPKHKGTDHMQAGLKRRISRLKIEIDAGRTRGKRRRSPFAVRKEGAGQVALVGPPNVGKSQLLCALTNAHSEVGVYPFTTHRPVPGMMPFEDLHVQLVDLPPVSRDHLEPRVFDSVRAADAVVVIIDLDAAAPDEQLVEVLDLLRQYHIELAPGPGATPDDFRVKLCRGMVLANKVDVEGGAETLTLLPEMVSCDLPMLAISALSGHGVEEARRALFGLLEVIRVYSKAPGKKADIDTPYTVRSNCALLEFASVVHKDFAAKLKSARVWGSTKFDGQVVSTDYVLQDKDIVELHMQ